MNELKRKKRSKKRHKKRGKPIYAKERQRKKEKSLID